MNFRNFRVFWFCSKNVEKNPIQVWKLGNFLIFFSKSHYYRGLFFRKKIVSDLAQNLLRWSSEEINVRNFGTFAIFFRKLKKNPIPFWNFWNFLSKTPSRRGLFFRKKRSSDLAQTSLRWSSDKINFELFGTFAIFFGKLEKNPIPSWKISLFFRKKFALILLKIGSDEVQTK